MVTPHFCSREQSKVERFLFFSASPSGIGYSQTERQNGRDMIDSTCFMAVNICFVLRDKLCGSENTGRKCTNSLLTCADL